MANESSALLPKSIENGPSIQSNTAALTGQASQWQTIANLMKTCMGTGCLALAYACQQGGIVVYTVGLVVIAAWNYVCICRLLQCLAYLPVLDGRNKESSSFAHARSPPPGTSTLGRVAWYAFGSWGVQVLDVLVVLLFLGIIIAYVEAVMTFMSDTPLGYNGRLWNAVLTGLIMGTISLVPDLGYLSGASAIGLMVLLSAFGVIFGYGLVARVEAPDDSLTPPQMQLWPSSLNGLSRWFGIVVFGYGIVPLTYNFQESMKEPHHIVQASMAALVGVAALYILLGVGLYALFPNLTADVLHELPATGWLPMSTRVALSCTVLTTGPLLIVPCAELIEGKWNIVTNTLRAVVRFGVVSVCVVVAVVLPNFVQVLSLVGCFCVALVSFGVPPILHLRLMYLQNTLHERPLSVVVDVCLAVWGLVVTVVSTLCTLRN